MATKTEKTVVKKVTTASASKKPAAKTTTAKAGSASVKPAGTSTAKKPAAAKTTGTTTAKKPAAPKAATDEFKLTAAEKKLIEAYRAASTDSRQAALAVLNGEQVEDNNVLASILSSLSGSA